MEDKKKKKKKKKMSLFFVQNKNKFDSAKPPMDFAEVYMKPLESFLVTLSHLISKNWGFPPLEEVNLRLSLREDVHWLQNELLFMQSFLRDAEEKQSGDQRVQQWVFEINSVANDAGTLY
ncbi:hypothetical protein HAX54_025393 [Datura stramonium]|uniref:Disease resistance N-terminal domain-containing protein n=1 Tax=Datura stramonium TaxID=4076 RepID=A0ABS8UZG1_DATST|nr:hypothetical protein [Datura stramonium]